MPKQPSKSRRIGWSSVRTLRRGPSLASQAHRHLKLLFMLGEMEPGRRLTYREVADRLGISVTPAREALCQLIGQRILDLRPGGVIVVPELAESTCRELWDIRLVLEGTVAEAATGHASPSLVKDLERSHALMAEAKQQRRVKDALKHNMNFHFSLYACAGMPAIVSLIEDIWARSAAYVRFFHSRHVEQRGEAAMQGPHVHATLISALRAGDGARVRNAIERDLLEVRDGALGLMRAEPDLCRPPMQEKPETERATGGLLGRSSRRGAAAT